MHLPGIILTRTPGKKLSSKRSQGGKFNQFNLSLCKRTDQFAYNLFGYAKLFF
jgi:hypothetical protein